MYKEFKIIPSGSKQEMLDFYNRIRSTIMTDVPSLAIHRIDIIEYNTKMDIDLLIIKLETLPIDTDVDLTTINPFTEFIFDIDINGETNNILTPKNIKTPNNSIISTLDENYTIYILNKSDVIHLRLYAEIDVPRSNDKWKSCYRCYRIDLGTDGFSILFRTNKPKTLKINIDNFIDINNRSVSKYSLIDHCYKYLAGSIKIYNTLLFTNNVSDLITFTRPTISDNIYGINIKRIIIKHIFNLWLVLHTYYTVKYSDFSLINIKLSSIINREIVGHSSNNIMGLLKIISSLLISPYLIKFTDMGEQIDIRNINPLNYARTDKMEIKLKDKLNSYRYFTNSTRTKDILLEFILEINKLVSSLGTQFDRMLNLIDSINPNRLNDSLRKVGYYTYFDTNAIWK